MRGDSAIPRGAEATGGGGGENTACEQGDFRRADSGMRRRAEVGERTRPLNRAIFIRPLRAFGDRRRRRAEAGDTTAPLDRTLRGHHHRRGAAGMTCQPLRGEAENVDCLLQASTARPRSPQVPNARLSSRCRKPSRRCRDLLGTLQTPSLALRTPSLAFRTPSLSARAPSLSNCRTLCFVRLPFPLSVSVLTSASVIQNFPPLPDQAGRRGSPPFPERDPRTVASDVSIFYNSLS